MKKIDEETKVECTNCDHVVFCSQQCEQSGSQQYHTFLCTNNKVVQSENMASNFLNFTKENNVKYPQMIAQFLSGMVAEEVEKNKMASNGESSSPYSAWDHIERFKSVAIEPSDASVTERNMIKDLLASKVPGIDEFLTDEIYLLLKGKLHECSYEIPIASEEEIAVEVNIGSMY
jgi:import receptor subunit TOM20